MERKEQSAGTQIARVPQSQARHRPPPTLATLDGSAAYNTSLDNIVPVSNAAAPAQAPLQLVQIDSSDFDVQAPSQLLQIRGGGDKDTKDTGVARKSSASCGRGMMRQRGHAASRALSRMLVSVVLQRHVLLLLVPLLYFWGMVLMVQQGGEWGVVESSFNSMQPSQDLLSSGSQAHWELHSQAAMQFRGMNNSTMRNFLVHPRGHLLTIMIDWERALL